MAFSTFPNEERAGWPRPSALAFLLPCLAAVPGGSGHGAGLPPHVGDIPWWAQMPRDLLSQGCPRHGGDSAFSSRAATEVSRAAERRSLRSHPAAAPCSCSAPETLGKQQGRDLDGLWLCWWLYKLIQVISRASLFVEKQEPTHRRAAFQFWTVNKVLISSRAHIFSFPSPPLNTFLYLFIFLFICFCLLLHSKISNSSNMTGLWSRLLACNASLCWSWADYSSPWLLLWTAKSEENPGFSKPEGEISWYRSCAHKRPVWL